MLDDDTAGGLGLRRLLRETAKFNGVAVVSLLIQPPTQLLIAAFLSPRDYGVVSLLGLWSLYAGLINPGTLSAGKREIPFLIAKGERARADKVQNVAISADLVYSFLPFLVICSAALVAQDHLVRIGLVITAVAYWVRNLSGYWSAINFVKQRFTVVAIGRLIGVLAVPLTILLLVGSLGVYAVLLGPVVGSLLSILFFLRVASIGFRFRFDIEEVIRLTKIGIVLSLTGILFYGYRLADRTIVASFLTLESLGIFSFAMVFVSFGLNFVADFTRVLEPILWEHSGKASDPETSFYATRRLARYLALASGVLVPMSQVGFVALVLLLVPAYQDSIPLFFILSNLLFLAGISAIPVIILQSAAIGRERIVSLVFGIGVAVNVLLDLLMVFLGRGIVGIAWVTVVSQGVFTIVFFLLAWRYMADPAGRSIKRLGLILLPFMVAAVFSLAHQLFLNDPASWMRVSVVSLAAQLVVWVVVIAVFYWKDLVSEFVITGSGTP